MFARVFMFGSLVLCSSAFAAVATESDKFAQVRGFKVDIDNAGGKEVDTAWESVHGGELNIETTDTTVGADKFQTTSPGHKTVGELRIRGEILSSSGRQPLELRIEPCKKGGRDLCLILSSDQILPREMVTWFQEVIGGKNIRKNITVTLFKSDKSPGRSYNLMDTFPTQWTSVDADSDSTERTETVRIKVGRIEFKT